MGELKDSTMGQAEIERTRVKILEDEFLIAKAHESKLEEELQAALEDAHYQESRAKKFEGEITKKEGCIIYLENKFSESITRAMSLEV